MLDNMYTKYCLEKLICNFFVLVYVLLFVDHIWIKSTDWREFHYMTNQCLTQQKVFAFKEYSTNCWLRNKLNERLSALIRDKYVSIYVNINWMYWKSNKNTYEAKNISIQIIMILST